MILMHCFTHYALYGHRDHDYASLSTVDWSISVDILSLLPTELALHILMLLCTPLSPPASPAPGSTDLETHPYPVPDPDSLRSILACLSVSRKWRALASDNSVWQALFLGRWAIDLRRANRPHKLIRQRCNKPARVDCKQFQRAISSDQRLLNKGCMVPQRSTNELPPLQTLPLSDFPPQRITSVSDTFSWYFSLILCCKTASNFCQERPAAVGLAPALSGTFCTGETMGRPCKAYGNIVPRRVHNAYSSGLPQCRSKIQMGAQSHAYPRTQR
jgi:hypothetical protein